MPAATRLLSLAPLSAPSDVRTLWRSPRPFLALLALLIWSAGFVSPASAAPWTATQDMTQVRASHTATLLPNGRLLVVGGLRNGFVSLATAELYDPATGVWTATGSLSGPRAGHSAVLLPTGQVWIVAGYNDGGVLATTELYDPASGVFVAGPTLPAPLYGNEVQTVLLPSGKVFCVNANLAATYDPAAKTFAAAAGPSLGRGGATLTLLSNGKLLLAGGGGGSSYTNSCELYDPATNSWSLAADLLTGRAYHAATRLLDGRVLVTGGYSGTNPNAAPNRKAEVYNPATDAWSAAPDLAVTRFSHAALLQPNGDVMVVGGLASNGNAVFNTEVFTPAASPGTGSWTAGSNVTYGHGNATITMLQSGRIIVVGGQTGGNPVARVELTDPALGSFSVTGALTARADHTTTLLPNGRILVAGGQMSGTTLNSAQLYDPIAGTWTSTGNLNTPRAYHTATLLRNGHVLVAGGANATNCIQTSETYDPATGTWTNAGNLLLTTGFHSAALLANGKVLVTGGWSGSFLQNNGQLYDPVARTWSATGNSLITARSLHASVLLTNGKVLVVGGQASGTAPGAYFNGVELYDPATNQFTSTGNLVVGRDRPSASLLRDGRVFVVGGGTSSGATKAAEIYNPTTGTWTATTNAFDFRTGVGTTLVMPSGKVLVGGGANAGGSTVFVEMFDPASASWNSVVNLSAGHSLAQLTYLPTGRALLAAGVNGTAETIDPLGAAAVAQPKVASATINAAGQLVLAGTGFRGRTVGAGHAADSSADKPQVWLRWLDNGQMLSVPPMPGFNSFSDTTYTSLPFVALRPGPAQVIVIVNGIHSAAATTGSDVSIVNLPVAPGVTGSAATLITSTSARLHASVTANGLATQVVFQVSSHPSFATDLRITAPQAFAGSASNQALTQDVTGLNFGTTYHFRAVASSAGAATYSATFSFNSLANAAPTATNPTIAAQTGDAKSVLSAALATDPEGDTLSVTAAATSAPAALTNLAFTAAGVTFTPALNFTGNATFTYTVNDGNGHPVSGTATVQVTDNKRPTGTAIVSGPSGSVSATTADFTFSGSDNIGVTAWRVVLDGQSQGDLAAASFHAANLAAGSHTLSVAAVDAAGNVDATPATRTWTIAVPPVLSQITVRPPQVFDAIANTWAAANGLESRYGHTATRLNDGRVLVTGGRLPDGATTSVEIFNANGTGSTLGPVMSTKRDAHTATLLTDGRVLVVGGRNVNTPTGSCEIYDPVSNGWTDAGSIPARHGHTATRLQDGRVLITGGLFITAYYVDADSAYLYDPATNSWSAAGPQQSNSLAARGGHTATLLANGDVLIAGGLSPIGPVSAGAIYRPASPGQPASWTSSGTLNHLRLRHTATLLPSGKVLIAAGDGPSGLLAAAEIYQPATDPAQAAFVPTTGGLAGRTQHSAVLMNNGSVAVLGGTNLNDFVPTVEMFEPGSERWVALPSMPVGRIEFPVVTLSNGDLLVISGSASPAAARYRPGRHLLRSTVLNDLTLSFNSSAPLQSVTATAGGQSLSATGTTSITATGTLAPGAPQGLMDLSISVSDAAGNVVGATGTTDGSRWIVDTVPPVVVPPPNVVVHATSPTGALATFEPATASDASGIVGELQYTQASGSFFANGVTNMLVRAYDAAGNEGQASFTVTVIPFSPVEAWRYEYFGSADDTGPGGDLADPDRDGIMNRLEFAFGTHPNGGPGSGALQFAGSFAAPVLVAAGQPIALAEGADRRVLFLRRADASAAALVYRVQFSADLQTWETSAASASLLTTSAGMELVSVPFPAIVAGQPARFVRVVPAVEP